MERLVVIWCPELLEEGARGEEARRFARVLARAGELCPWVHPVRLGVGALPARGPARFFGGEEAVVSRLAETVGEEAGIGVADGLFAALLAARSGLIVPAGGTADFLGPWSVATLARPDLAVTLQRLGVTTLGQFAALPAASVSDRFGADAAACHAVARGESGELVGLRDRAIERRLRVARGEDPDRGADAPPPTLPARLLRRRVGGRRPGRPLLRPGAGAPRHRRRADGPGAGRAGPGRPVGAGALGQPRGRRGRGRRRAVAGAVAATGAERRAADPAPAPRWPTPPAVPSRSAGGGCSPRASSGCRSTGAPGSRSWGGPAPGR